MVEEEYEEVEACTVIVVLLKLQGPSEPRRRAPDAQHSYKHCWHHVWRKVQTVRGFKDIGTLIKDRAGIKHFSSGCPV